MGPQKASNYFVGSRVTSKIRAGFICRAEPACGVAFHTADCASSLAALMAASAQRTEHEQQAHGYVHTPGWIAVAKRGPQIPPTWRRRPERAS